MTKEELIKYLTREIPKRVIKCQKTKIKFIKIYRLGNLYIQSELYRRLTGKRIGISRAYFND